MDNIDLESGKSFVDTLWVIDCAILVFIMQAGFMCMETGLSRHKNSINVALKNAADFGLSVVVFWIFGFGLMFGSSWNGIIGTDLFFFKTENAEYMTYFVFQAMFVATAATIFSGAVAERMPSSNKIRDILMKVAPFLYGGAAGSSIAKARAPELWEGSAIGNFMDWLPKTLRPDPEMPSREELSQYIKENREGVAKPMNMWEYYGDILK